LSVSPADATKPPAAMSSVAGTRLWSLPRTSSRIAPGSDAKKFTSGDRRDEQVEQEVVARLVRVERVRQDAPLGHEHVGGEEGAEREREAAGDVQERA
jgi:hypothetical protein